MPIPHYYRIYRDLQYKICTGEYAPGTMLPREIDLEKIYGTSRAPVRQALGCLETEGLITRQPGKGTFVTRRQRTFPWLLSSGFAQSYEKNWNQLSHQTISIELITAPTVIADFLRLKQKDQRVIHLTRCQSINERPVILIHAYISKDYDIRVFHDAGHFMSWKELLRSKFDKTISCIKDSLNVQPLSVSDAHHLALDPQTVCLTMTRYGYDEKNAPLFCCINYVRPGTWDYEVSFQQVTAPSFHN